MEYPDWIEGELISVANGNPGNFNETLNGKIILINYDGKFDINKIINEYAYNNGVKGVILFYVGYGTYIPPIYLNFLVNLPVLLISEERGGELISRIENSESLYVRMKMYNDYKKIADFSSRGPVPYSIKPDIVAPGVSICAAQSKQDTLWQSIMNDYGIDIHCLDMQHISISGTSMATPHVSGIVALLKQKKFDLSPDEIKFILRDTTNDLGNDRLNHGFGLVNALSSVLFDKIPPIISLNISYKIGGIINISGEISTENLDYYTLSYKEDFTLSHNSNGESVWHEFYNSSNYKNDGILFENWDTSELIDGNYFLRLQVFDRNGKMSEEYSTITIRNIDWYVGFPFEDGEPIYYHTHKELIEGIFITKDIFNITGKITGDKIKNFSFVYAKEEFLDNYSDLGITLNLNLPIVNDTLATWNVSQVNNGNYVLYLTVNYIGNGVYKDKRKFTVEKRSKAGWPQYAGSYVKVDEIDSLMLGKEILSTAIPGYLGVRHLNGELYGEWPKYINYSATIMPSIGDIDGDGSKEIIITGGKGFRQNTKIYAFDSSGNNLPNWPKDNFDYTSYQIILKDMNKDNKLDIIVPSVLENISFYTTGTYPWDIKIDIFNYNGTNLDGWPRIFQNNIGYYKSLVVGDINNDSLNEVIFSVSKGGWSRPNDNPNVTIYALDYLGEMLKGFPITINVTPVGSFVNGQSVYSLSDMTIADIDEDGIKEIIIEINQKLYVISGEGSIKNGFPIEIPGSISSVGPVIGEIDSSISGKEIAFTYLNFTSMPTWKTTQYLYVIDSNGNRLDNFPLEVCSKKDQWVDPISNEQNELAIYDLDKDENDDILVACELNFNSDFNNKIYAFNKDGKLMDDFPYYFLFGDVLNFMFWGNGIGMGDIDNDGKTELFEGSTYYGITYVWDMGNQFNDEKPSWSTYRFDNKNTGCYDCEIISTTSTSTSSSTSSTTIEFVPVGSPGGGASSGGGGNSKSKSFSEIKANELIKFSITMGISVTDLELILKEERRNVKLKVNKLYSLSNIPKVTQGEVYEYFEIESGIEEKLFLNSKIKFKVENNWLEKNGYDKNEIGLRKYQDGKWIKVEVRSIGSDIGYTYFEANPKGFSIFSIIAEKITQGVENLCGNSIIDVGENCRSCGLDIKCQSDEFCDNSGICQRKTQQIQQPVQPIEQPPLVQEEQPKIKTTDLLLKNYITVLIGGVVTLVLLIIAIVIYLMATRKPKFKEEHLEEMSEIERRNYERLTNIIEENLSKGYSREEIRKVALDSGWDENLIDKVMRNIK